MDNCHPHKQPIVIIAGPTGSGKSAVSQKLYRLFEHPRIEIISADSRQIYRFMDIGTDKPKLEILKTIPHHMIDLITPDQEFSAGEYRTETLKVLKVIRQNKAIPVIVGGTGLYIRVLLGGLATDAGKNVVIRNRLHRELEEEGAGALHLRLSKLDPDRAKDINPEDTYRIIRTLEIIESGIDSPSQVFADHQFDDSPFLPLFFVLNVDRVKLYNRIEARVDQMVAAGLFQEVAMILSKFGEKAPGLTGIGYKQVVMFFKNLIGREEAIRLIKRDTRRYAKRQMTWFRKEKGVIGLNHDPDNSEITVESIKSNILTLWERYYE